MNYTVSLIFSFSIAIAAIAGWVRFKRLGPAFYPFLVMVTLATCNETISAIIIKVFHKSNAINANIYSLIEALIITWQFKNWKLFRSSGKLFYAICLLLILVWCIEIFYLSSIRQFSSYFNIFYGFVTAMMSISMINYLLLLLQPTPVTKSILIICICFIIFYTYSALIEIFWIWGLGASKIFRRDIFRILYFINLFSNLAYAFAILWVPRKRTFLSPS